MTSTVTMRSTANAGSPGRSDSHATSVTTPATMRHDGEEERGAVGQGLRADRDVWACSTRRMMPRERRPLAGAGDLDAQRPGAVDRARR